MQHEIALACLKSRQELVSREDIAKRLWSPDVFTDLDAGIRNFLRKAVSRSLLSTIAASCAKTAPGL